MEWTDLAKIIVGNGVIIGIATTIANSFIGNRFQRNLFKTTFTMGKRFELTSELYQLARVSQGKTIEALNILKSIPIEGFQVIKKHIVQPVLIEKLGEAKTARINLNNFFLSNEYIFSMKINETLRDFNSKNEKLLNTIIKINNEEIINQDLSSLELDFNNQIQALLECLKQEYET